MKNLVVAVAVGAAALAGGSAANAATIDSKAKPGMQASESTDFSSHRRHGYRHGYYRPYRSYGGYYRPYRSYGYYNRPYGGYYGGGPYGYYGGGPGISFSFGSGGYRW
ncbi:MAG: hypothetical protein HY852_17045 [Bradyrhizobium sp.]|uniref:hypothetical protein n=1 Tax=Bradyrhizobium sp. TaxID=376 RepID=UPI0025BE1557|nr:hypothetical protein [Bradyrhizobium sp.]MBI5263519.1 hypothetical protein [Bradyrhizobium sp.]